MIPERTTVSRDHRGLIACTASFLIGVLVLVASRQYTPLGSVFPRTIAVLMMILSGLYIIQVLRKPQPVQFETGGSNFRRAAMFAIMLFWAFSLEPVGFLTTSLIAYALALLVANFNRWSAKDVVIYFSTGAVVVTALYALFKHVLNVPLPVGLLL